MTINVECDSCGARNRFPDAKAGKTSRCQSCGERITVQGRRSSKKKKSSGGNGLLIGVAVGAIALVIIAAAVFFLTSNPAEKPEIAQESNSVDPATSNAPVAEETTVADARMPDPTATPLPATLESSTPQAQPNRGGFEPPRPTTGAGGFDKEGGLTFAKSANWNVAVDPPSSNISYDQPNSRPIKLAKDGLRGSGLVFPVAPSSLVAVRTGTGSKSEFEVYDLTSGKQVSSSPSPGSSSVAALADNGSYLAATLPGNQKIVVHDLSNNKTLGTLTTSETNSFQVSQLAIWKDRLAALSNVHKGIMVWDLPSGELKHEIKGSDKLSSDYGFAFSPGGKYVCVVGDYLEKRLEIYDLEAGKLAGAIIPQGSVKVSELEAVGFSGDGKQLAACYGVDVYGAAGKKYSRMIVWDLPSGQVSSDFELDLRLKDELNPVYQAHTLESLPGSNRWLVNSLGVIDATVGKLIYSLPKEEGVDFVQSRKVMGPNWVIGATTGKGDPRLEATEFTEEQLQAGIASASAGGLASDATMPPLTPTDFQEAPDAIVENQWSAAPDPLSAQQIAASIKITIGGTVRDVAIARSATPIVAVRAGIREDMTDPSIVNYERNREIYAKNGLDLERPQPVAEETQIVAVAHDGSPVNDFRVPYSAMLRGVSADGQLVLLEQHRTNGRLDLYSVGTGEHRTGWRPYRPENDEKNREIQTAQFVDSEHVATLSKNMKLVVWKIPSLEPVWKLDEVQEFVVSPAGNTIALVQGNTLGAKNLAILKTKTGDGLGSIEIDGKFLGMAFHPNGASLAMSVDTSANQVLRIVDIVEGEISEEFPIPSLATSLCWTGDDFLLLDGTQLVSRSLQAVVWSYDTKELVLPEFQASDKITFVSAQGKPAVHTVQLPQEKVASRLDPARLTDQALLSPGDAVKLDVQIGSDPLLSPLKTAPEMVQKQLEAAKSTVSQEASVTLAVKVTSNSEGTTNLTKIGDRSVSMPVTRKIIAMEFVYQQGGREIWKTTRKVSNLDRLIVHLEQGQSAQDGIDQQMLKSAEAVLSSMKLPTYIFKEGAGKGLGTSSILE